MEINILVFKTLEDYKKQIKQRYKYHGEHLPLNYLLECYDYFYQNKDYYGLLMDILEVQAEYNSQSLTFPLAI